jgi:hypothetical protein
MKPQKQVLNLKLRTANDDRTITVDHFAHVMTPLELRVKMPANDQRVKIAHLVRTTVLHALIIAHLVRTTVLLVPIIAHLAWTTVLLEKTTEHLALKRLEMLLI